jgi:putative endonuclease
MADTEKQKLGALGEDIAANHLEENGYTVIGRNLRFGRNEIDIVAENADFTVFVEVKTRSCLYPESGDFGVPGRAVDEKKRGNTVAAVRSYLAQNHATKQPRIDVIEVYMLEDKNEFKIPKILRINHIRNAFSSRGRKNHC